MSLSCPLGSSLFILVRQDAVFLSRIPLPLCSWTHPHPSASALLLGKFRGLHSSPLVHHVSSIHYRVRLPGIMIVCVSVTPIRLCTPGGTMTYSLLRPQHGSAHSRGHDSCWLKNPISTLITGAVVYWTQHMSSVLMPSTHAAFIPHNNYIKHLCLSPIFLGSRSLKRQCQSKWGTPRPPGQIQGWKGEWEKEEWGLSFVFSQGAFSRIHSLFCLLH